MADHVVRYPSDDPPTFSDEARTCLYIRGTYDFAVAVGPKDGPTPMHWVCLRTSGGADEFMVSLVAAAFHHLSGRREQAKACAHNASTTSDHEFDRAEHFREQWLAEEPKRSAYSDHAIREHAADMSLETWEAIGRARGWIPSPQDDAP